MVLSLIVAGSILALTLINHNRSRGVLNITGTQFFVVKAGNYNTLQEANSSANAIRSAGGAGFIINNDNGFNVSIAVYSRLSDATAIASRLNTQQDFNATVATIEIAPMIISASNSECASDFSQFLTQPIEVFNSLMRHNQDLEEGNITDHHAITILTQMRNVLNQQLAALNNFNTEFVNYVSQLIEFYRDFSRLVSDTIALRLGATLAGNIRHLTIATIYNFHNLANDFSQHNA